MCGFVGFASVDASLDNFWLSTSNSKLTHRGPDDVGEWISEKKNVGLAHCRLSIIDLSDGGQQPFIDSNTNCILVFNGEIYNYKELRRKLISRNVKFRSTSDTEVLLQSYIFWGTECLAHLRGMFSFAIFDPRKNIIFFARDQVGEKPLYYHIKDGNIIFGSELKALFSIPNLERKLNWGTVDSYLTMGFVTGKDTLVSGFSKVAPAHAMTFSVETGQTRTWRYWEVPKLIEPTEHIVSDKFLVDELENLLEKSVQRQAKADVPVGVLLSGGLDSSLITALASQFTSNLMTFTVGIKDHKKLDESDHANLISQHFGTNHHLLYADLEIDTLLHKLAYQFDEPIMDSSMIPTFLVSEFVSAHCKVVLGGDGGDELFGGYGHYSRLSKMANYAAFLPLFLRSSISNFSEKILSTGSFKSNISNWIGALGADFKTDLPLIARYFNKKERAALLKGYNGHIICGEAVYRGLSKDTSDIVSRATRTDFETYLPEDLLIKVDRASMMNSLEVRAPFLDLDVVNFAFSKVPSMLKVKNSNKKILLKALAEKVLPNSFDFQRKQGFSIPIGEMFAKEPLKSLLHDTLLADSCIFNRTTVEKLLAMNRKGFQNSEGIFGLLMFELWRVEHKISL